MSKLCCLSPEDLTLLATAISIDLSRGKTTEEMFVLRNVASQIAQTLFLIASQHQFLATHCGKTESAVGDTVVRIKTFDERIPKK